MDKKENTYKSFNLLNLESANGNAPVNLFDCRTLNKHSAILNTTERSRDCDSYKKTEVSEELQFF